MRILLAIDESPHSDCALETVAQRPWPDASVVRVLSVAQDLARYIPELWPGPMAFPSTEADAAAQRRAQEIVERGEG